MNNAIIGIVDNTLYLEPFYAGDHEHEATISDWTKADLVERGVKVFDNYDHIEAHLRGLSYNDLIQERAIWERNRIDELGFLEASKIDDDLPF